MTTLSEVGKRIKEKRLELQLTQEELAKRTGYTSRSSINKIELGYVDLPQSKINIIAEALGVSPIYLISGNNDASVDYLLGKEQEKPAPQKGSELDEEIISLLHSLPAEQQRAFYLQIKALAADHAEKSSVKD